MIRCDWASWLHDHHGFSVINLWNQMPQRSTEHMAPVGSMSIPFDCGLCPRQIQGSLLDASGIVGAWTLWTVWTGPFKANLGPPLCSFCAIQMLEKHVHFCKGWPLSVAPMSWHWWCERQRWQHTHQSSWRKARSSNTCHFGLCWFWWFLSYCASAGCFSSLCSKFPDVLTQRERLST